MTSTTVNLKDKLKEKNKEIKELKYDRDELEYELMWSYTWGFINGGILIGLTGVLIYTAKKKFNKNI